MSEEQKLTVTVLIPTYLRPNLLRRAVESVLSQTYTNFIIRVFDNGDDSQTALVMKEYSAIDKRVQYFRNPSNLGRFKNFQNLIASVETPLYLMMSDDDFLLTNHLETSVDAFKNHPEIMFCSCATITVDETRDCIHARNSVWEDGVYHPSIEVLRKLSHEHFTSTGTVYRKELRDAIGGFHIIGLDELFSIITSGIYPFYVSSKPSAVFVISDGTITASGGVARVLEINKILDGEVHDKSIISRYAENSNKYFLLAHVANRYAYLMQQRIHLISQCDVKLGVDEAELVSSLVFFSPMAVARIFFKHLTLKLKVEFIVRFAKYFLGKVRPGREVRLSEHECILKYLAGDLNSSSAARSRFQSFFLSE